MPINAATESLETIGEGGMQAFKVLFGVGFLLQWAGSDALEIMSLMLRSIQFVLHIPILQMYLPANVMMFYSAMLPVVCWDMLEGWFDFSMVGYRATEENGAPIPGQIEELGY